MKLEEIKELIKLFGKSKLERLQIKQKDFELEMERSSGVNTATATPQPAAPLPQQTATEAIQNESPAQIESKKKLEGEVITSPMVGTLYSSPSPDSPPFVRVGDSVKKGDVLCILEAMKIMNELEAEYDCKILEILAENGEPVEYGKPLFVVERI
jgi:acetyl-CoA carboxylase biotin carboxyl carrier protein